MKYALSLLNIVCLLGVPASLFAGGQKRKTPPSIEQKTTAAAIASGDQAADQKARKYRHQVREFEHEKKKKERPPLTVVSSDGVRVRIPGDIARNPWFSVLLVTALEED